MKAPTKSKIVSAVGTATNGGGSKAMAAEMEAAMSRAITDAFADGVSDPDEQRKRMLAARADVKAKWAKVAADQAAKDLAAAKAAAKERGR